MDSQRHLNCLKNMISSYIDTMANIEYGLLIAIIIVALLLFSLSSINGRKQLNVLSFLIALLLVGLLTFQMSRLIGACNISNDSSMVSDLVGAVSPTLGKYVSSYTSHDVGWFIFRRVMWSVLFLSIGGFCIYTTMDVNGRRRHFRTSGDRIEGRKERISSRRRR